mmetsp:Transcript_8272/g.13730  ORF Transcript_8272/g.13730 Transcript_8272/m.13730 type:complete len:219 (+) Transcript_8272:320-976(+)
MVFRIFFSDASMDCRASFKRPASSSMYSCVRICFAMCIDTSSSTFSCSSSICFSKSLPTCPSKESRRSNFITSSSSSSSSSSSATSVKSTMPFISRFPAGRRACACISSSSSPSSSDATSAPVALSLSILIPVPVPVPIIPAVPTVFAASISSSASNFAVEVPARNDFLGGTSAPLLVISTLMLLISSSSPFSPSTEALLSWVTGVTAFSTFPKSISF